MTLTGFKKHFYVTETKYLSHHFRPNYVIPPLQAISKLVNKNHGNHGAGYLGDFLTVKPPGSLAMEDRFMVEWEYTLFSFVPRKRKRLN